MALLQERGFDACEIDFEGGFWMDYPWAEQFGRLARKAKIFLSVHAPIAGFMGHVEHDKKQRMAVGMLDHSACVAKVSGAELVVFHPGFLLDREREAALESIVEQLGELRERLEGKGRAVPFGVGCAGFGRVARWTRSRQLATCGVALVVTAIMAGCGGSSDPRTLSANVAVTVVKRAATVAPTTTGWNWPKVPTSSSPYAEDEGGYPPSTPDPLAAKLYRQLRRL
jgi:hypothetical protein